MAGEDQEHQKSDIHPRLLRIGDVPVAALLEHQQPDRPYQQAETAQCPQ
jgi:hypothetical protein